MADYTEEQRVKQRIYDAYCHHTPSRGYQIRYTRFAIMRRVTRLLSGWRKSEALAWADASYRMGNEFVDEVGPLAERKEG